MCLFGDVTATVFGDVTHTPPKKQTVLGSCGRKVGRGGTERERTPWLIKEEMLSGGSIELVATAPVDPVSRKIDHVNQTLRNISLRLLIERGIPAIQIPRQ